MKRIKYVLINSIVIFLSIFIKRNHNYIVFGSWCGESYNDNSKYLLEYLIKNQEYTDYKIVWIGKKSIKGDLPKRVFFSEINTFKSAILLLKCKYMFFTQMARTDISIYNVYKKAILCFLDHGIPIKKWGMDVNGYDGNLEYKNLSYAKRIWQRFTGESQKYTYFIASSELHKKTYLSSMKYKGANEDNILLTGTPRNDILLNYSQEQKLMYRKKYNEILGIKQFDIIILYLPTYRINVNKIESFLLRNEKELVKLNELLKKFNAVILEKNHFAANKYSCNLTNIEYSNIKKINKPVDLQELMIISNIQISDYSGSIIDYLLLDKPIIHYIYDYEYYKTYDSGLYYSKDFFAAGAIAYSFNECYDQLKNILSGIDMYSDLRKIKKTQFVHYELGKSAEKITNIVIK